MRSRSFLAAAMIIGVSAAATACGNVHGGTAGAASSRIAGDAKPAACGSATWHSSRVRAVNVSVSDNGKALCVRRGTALLVILKGTPASMWAPIHASSSALVPRADGHLMLMRGYTGASFAAAHPGTASIVSTRSPCGPRVSPTRPPTSGKATCGVIMLYQVKVVVVG